MALLAYDTGIRSPSQASNTGHTGGMPVHDKLATEHPQCSNTSAKIYIQFLVDCKEIVLEIYWNWN